MPEVFVLGLIFGFLLGFMVAAAWSAPTVDLHVAGVVRPMRQCTYLGDILDDERDSMLALSLLEHFEGQRVEVTVRVLEHGELTDE